MNAAIIRSSLTPFADSTPLETSTAHGRTPADRFAHVPGIEPAREHHRPGEALRGEAPVEGFARAPVQVVPVRIEQPCRSVVKRRQVF